MWSVLTEQPPAEQDTLVDALVQSAFTTMAVLNKLAAEHDLSLTQARVLGILRDRRLGITELADYLGLDKSTMTGLVARAEKRGLLQRTTSARDGRAVRVSPTAAGHELIDRVRGRIEQSLTPMIDRLTPTERRRLQALLERLLGSGEPAGD